MQVFSSYFFCVKLLSVAILSAQHVVGDSLDNTQGTTENGLTTSIKGNSIEERTTVELKNEVISTIALNTTTATLIPTTSTENGNTATHFTSKIIKNTSLSIPPTSTTTETVTTTTPTASTQAQKSTTINPVTSISTTSPTASTFANYPTLAARLISPITDETATTVVQTTFSTSNELTNNLSPTTTSTTVYKTSSTPTNDQTSSTMMPIRARINDQASSSMMPITATTNDQSSTTMAPITHTTNDPSSNPTTPTNSSTTEHPSSNPTTPTNSSTTEQPCTLVNSIDLIENETLQTAKGVNITALSIGKICPTEIDIICNAGEDNNNVTWQWVITSRNVTFQLSDINSTIDLVIGNLSEFTNYSCEVIRHDDYFFYDEFMFQTKQEVPSRPVNLNITTLSPTSFNITWKEPDKIPSLLEGYELNITRKNVASDGHLWNNCSGQGTYTWTTSQNYVLFDKALADFIYYIEVAAKSSAGNSDAASDSLQTPAAESEPPGNVTFNPSEIEIEENMHMSQEISWDIPCNSNGPVTHFQVELNGVYSHNNQSRYDPRNRTVPILSNQTTYSLNFSDIFAASVYTVKIYLTGQMTGKIHEDTFETKDNYPSALKFDAIITHPNNFTITWNGPDNYPGNISYYTIRITGNDVNWFKTKYCNISDGYYDVTYYTESTSYFNDKVIPDANYMVTINAETSRGPGILTNQTVTSSMTYPDRSILNTTINQLDTYIYNDTATIQFKNGCFNGKFDSYIIGFHGTREGYNVHSDSTRLTNYEVEEYTFGLQPEFHYSVNISIINEQYGIENVDVFTAPAGVPVIDNTDPTTIPIQTEGNQVSLTLKQEYFNTSQGHLQYLAIIISNKNITGGSFNRWIDNSQWPIPQKQDDIIYYQASETFWNPFSGGSNAVEYVIGENTTCVHEEICNKPLESGTEYFLFFRLFNDNYYRNTMPISIITDKTSALGMILGILASLVFLTAVAFIIFMLWRKGYIKLNHYERHGYKAAIEDNSDASLTYSDERLRKGQCIRPPTEAPRTEIAKKHFVAYCKSLEKNPALLTAQWTELENQSKSVYDELPHHFATLPENRRKNRYTNILPFDHSRVKIHIDEDNEICSDYINASFITGYSGKNEYIATQGPLHETCRDFWKMILQERVSIIVMVSRFIENNKDKCYRYFPQNRETMTVGDDIEVRCSTELHFGFYCIRTLQVKKELAQVTVTHMQFLEWPDFGVPSGTESMLNFCHQFKERWISEGGMALVHCSAGVGRTGTLIATDILLRVLAAGKKLDVFNTVLELRRERKSMVQTEKQYMYIYQLISSMIEFPIVDEQDNDEHLYENIGGNNNGIVESAL